MNVGWVQHGDMARRGSAVSMVRHRRMPRRFVRHGCVVWRVVHVSWVCRRQPAHTCRATVLCRRRVPGTLEVRCGRSAVAMARQHFASQIPRPFHQAMTLAHVVPAVRAHRVVQMRRVRVRIVDAHTRRHSVHGMCM